MAVLLSPYFHYICIISTIYKPITPIYNTMNGKKKCELLRSIRKHIAELNGIAYTPTECHHEVCSTGTCPMCDAEAEHIMTELERLEAEGKTILIGDGMPGKAEDLPTFFSDYIKAERIKEIKKLFKDIATPGIPNCTIIPETEDNPQEWD